MDDRPMLGITMGDPAGIGPEIAAKALSHENIYEICRPLVIGDAGVMKQALKIAGFENEILINPVTRVEEAKFQYNIIDVFDLCNVDITKLEYGKVSVMCGKAAFEAVEKVIELAKTGKIDATVTGPINKESINAAGFHFSGHTEIYAHFTSTKDYTMLLVEGNLRVVHVSTHVSLRQACDMVKKDRVLDVIKLAYDACGKFGIINPKIGVAGLNPHAGENGMFGDEETEEIIPAVEAAKTAGINVEGPIPPDTLFSKASGGLYDIVVAMYHDQGHIPLKVLGFKWNDSENKWDSVSGVNITLGLPIIRCSVDHGTAFDKAGKGTAVENSMLSAIEYGVKLTRNKKTPGIYFF